MKGHTEYLLFFCFVFSFSFFFFFEHRKSGFQVMRSKVCVVYVFLLLGYFFRPGKDILAKDLSKRSLAPKYKCMSANGRMTESFAYKSKTGNIWQDFRVFPHRVNTQLLFICFYPTDSPICF